MNIRVKKYGIIGYYARCNHCDWDAAILTKETYSTQNVRDAIKKHVKKTGHTVHLESTSDTRYSLYFDIL